MEVSRNPKQEFSERKRPKTEWRRGFGLLKYVAIDVHVMARNRQFDLVGVIQSQVAGFNLHTGKSLRIKGTNAVTPVATRAPQVYDFRHDARASARRL